MKTCWRWFVFLFALLIFSPPARAVMDRVVDQTFSVKTPVNISVETFSGGILVTTSDSPQLRVVVRQTVEAIDEKAAAQMLAKLELKLAQFPDGSVRLKIRPLHAVRWTWQNWSPAALSIEMSVPRDCQLDLRTEQGAVTVGAVRGVVSARTAVGALFIGEVEGDITATNLRGDIAVTACSGGMKLLSKNGNILVGRTAGRTELSTVDGVIEIQAARGAVIARGNRSDIKVTFAHPLLHPADLKADGGDIAVGFDARTAATLNLRASKFGSVRVRDLDLTTVTGKPGESALTGTLNGGGPLIKVRASGGQVRVNNVPSL
jgi:hypothetical protein